MKTNNFRSCKAWKNKKRVIITIDDKVYTRYPNRLFNEEEEDQVRGGGGDLQISVRDTCESQSLGFVYKCSIWCHRHWVEKEKKIIKREGSKTGMKITKDWIQKTKLQTKNRREDQKGRVSAWLQNIFHTMKLWVFFFLSWALFMSLLKQSVKRNRPAVVARLLFADHVTCTCVSFSKKNTLNA